LPAPAAAANINFVFVKIWADVFVQQASESETLCDYMCSAAAIFALAVLLSPCLAFAADDWSVTPAARDGSATANSHILIIPNIIRSQTGYLTITNNTCGHFAIVAAGSPSHPCGGITVSSFARENRCHFLASRIHLRNR
jgi:hypothetical protein